MAKKKNKFYVVWQGRVPGVYQDWDACLEQVKGVKARYKSFDSLAQAECAYKEGPDKYISSTGNHSIFKSKQTPSNLTIQEMKRMGIELPALAVDAACSGNPGRWRRFEPNLDFHPCSARRCRHRSLLLESH